MTATLDLAEDLTGLVRGLPGVTFLYPAAPLLEALPSGSLRHPIVVTGGDGALSVTVVLGIDEEDPAPTVCRTVHDSVVAFLTASGHEVDEVDVKVASIG